MMRHHDFDVVSVNCFHVSLKRPESGNDQNIVLTTVNLQLNKVRTFLRIMRVKFGVAETTHQPD